jgi:hypothetical protein
MDLVLERTPLPTERRAPAQPRPRAAHPVPTVRPKARRALPEPSPAEPAASEVAQARLRLLPYAAMWSAGFVGSVLLLGALFR